MQRKMFILFAVIHQLDAAMNDEKWNDILEERKKDLMALFEPSDGQPAKKRSKKDDLSCSSKSQNIELNHHTSSSFSDTSFVPSIQETENESSRQSSTCSLGHSDAQQVSFSDNEITATQHTCANQSKTLDTLQAGFELGSILGKPSIEEEVNNNSISRNNKLENRQQSCKQDSKSSITKQLTDSHSTNIGTRRFSVIKFANSSIEQADQSNFENPIIKQSSPKHSRKTGVIQVSTINTEILDAEQAGQCKIVCVDLEESSIGSFTSLCGEQGSQDNVLSPGSGQIGDDDFLILDTRNDNHNSSEKIVITLVDERDKNLRTEQDNLISFESLAANQTNLSISQNSDTMPAGTIDDENAGTKQKSLNNIGKSNTQPPNDNSVNDFTLYYSSSDEEMINNDSLTLHDSGENEYTKQLRDIPKTSINDPGTAKNILEGKNNFKDSVIEQIGHSNSEILDTEQKSSNNIESLNLQPMNDSFVDDLPMHFSSGDEDTIDNDSLQLNDCGENGYTEELGGIEKTSNDHIEGLDIPDTCNPPYSDRFRARDKGLVFLSFKAYVTATRARRREEVEARKAVRAQRALSKTVKRKRVAKPSVKRPKKEKTIPVDNDDELVIDHSFSRVGMHDPAEFNNSVGLESRSLETDYKPCMPNEYWLDPKREEDTKYLASIVDYIYNYNPDENISYEWYQQLYLDFIWFKCFDYNDKLECYVLKNELWGLHQFFSEFYVCFLWKLEDINQSHEFVNGREKEFVAHLIKEMEYIDVILQLYTWVLNAEGEETKILIGKLCYAIHKFRVEVKSYLKIFKKPQYMQVLYALVDADPSKKASTNSTIKDGAQNSENSDTVALAEATNDCEKQNTDQLKHLIEEIESENCKVNFEYYRKRNRTNVKKTAPAILVFTIMSETFSTRRYTMDNLVDATEDYILQQNQKLYAGILNIKDNSKVVKNTIFNNIKFINYIKTREKLASNEQNCIKAKSDNLDEFKDRIDDIKASDFQYDSDAVLKSWYLMLKVMEVTMLVDFESTKKIEIRSDHFLYDQRAE